MIFLDLLFETLTAADLFYCGGQLNPAIETSVLILIPFVADFIIFIGNLIRKRNPKTSRSTLLTTVEDLHNDEISCFKPCRLTSKWFFCNLSLSYFYIYSRQYLMRLLFLIRQINWMITLSEIHLPLNEFSFRKQDLLKLTKLIILSNW